MLLYILWCDWRKFNYGILKDAVTLAPTGMKYLSLSGLCAFQTLILLLKFHKYCPAHLIQSIVGRVAKRYNVGL